MQQPTPRLERLLTFFVSSPTMRLLRSPQAPYIVAFLNATFKDAGKITWGHNDLAARLADFQDQLDQSRLDQSQPDPNQQSSQNQQSGVGVLRESAEAYLQRWSTGEVRWLRRRLAAATAEPVYELSPQSECVLRFVSEMLDQRLGFVGTESRLRRIVDSLTDLAIRGNDDPQQRLDYLLAQREQIDAEIASIRQAGVAETYSPTAIRERFADTMQDLTQLQSDFRAVEESFQTITRQVHQQTLAADRQRGDILQDALDAEEQLQRADQGISFHEFVRFVLAPANQEHLEAVAQRLRQVDALSDQPDALQRVEAMVPALLGEAEKVLATTHRLSKALRRLLDAKTTASRQRLAGLLADIRGLAGQLAEQPPEQTVSLQIATELDLGNAFQKAFWQPSTRFTATTMHDGEDDADDRLDAFKRLAQLPRIDWSAMRRSVTMALGNRDEISLAEMLQSQPSRGGVLEVLGYIQIAHDDGHLVDRQHVEQLPLALDPAQPQQTVLFDVPRVVFRQSKTFGAVP